MNRIRQLHGMLFCIALLMAGCSPSGPKEQARVAAPAAKPEAAETQAAASTPAAEAPDATDSPMAVSAPAQEAAAATSATVGATEATATTPAPAVTPATPAAAPAPPPTAAPASSPAAQTPASAVPVPAPVAATSTTPAAPAATSAITDPGGAIAVAATKPGLERVGADTCGNCHDVQFESWAGSAHAGRTPPLDCEDCHGPGSEYKAKSVMTDAAKAKAAGLVMPDKTFCATCHQKGVDDAFMAKAHAHEE